MEDRTVAGYSVPEIVYFFNGGKSSITVTGKTDLIKDTWGFREFTNISLLYDDLNFLGGP